MVNRLTLSQKFSGYGGADPGDIQHVVFDAPSNESGVVGEEALVEGGQPSNVVGYEWKRMRGCDRRCNWRDPTFKCCLGIAYPSLAAYPIQAPGYMIK